MATFTHYSATINLPNSGIFPLYGPINDANMLMLANNGTTPHSAERIAELQPEADRIRTALLAGKYVGTKSATISPLTTEQYNETK